MLAYFDKSPHQEMHNTMRPNVSNYFDKYRHLVLHNTNDYSTKANHLERYRIQLVRNNTILQHLPIGFYKNLLQALRDTIYCYLLPNHSAECYHPLEHNICFHLLQIHNSEKLSNHFQRNTMHHQAASNCHEQNLLLG